MLSERPVLGKKNSGEKTISSKCFHLLTLPRHVNFQELKSWSPNLPRKLVILKLVCRKGKVNMLKMPVIIKISSPGWYGSVD